MKTLIFFILSTLSCERVITAATSFPLESQDLWESYKNQFGKIYSTKEEEENHKGIFFENKLKIEKHNAEFENGLHSYKMKLNSFADMTPQEIKNSRKGYNNRHNNLYLGNRQKYIPSGSSNVPESYDWRSEGAVTEVKDQKYCESCWAFSATGCLEGQYFMKKGKLLSFSEQYLIDCSKKFHNYGCKGGMMDNAFRFVEETGGVDLEAKYPYKAKDKACKNISPDVHFNVTKYVDIERGNETQLKEAVFYKGPISVAIDARHTFAHYHEGVYYIDHCSETHLDHAVLVVGYGESDEFGPYWIIKNSWGKHWGMNGYVMLARDRGNVCGIATIASYPEIS